MSRTLAYLDLDRTPASLSGEALDAFRGRLRGPSFLVDDPGYEEARAVWNGMITDRPALVVRPTGPADVAEAVAFAREHRILTSVKGGGHQVGGNALVDRGLTIDLSGMRHVVVDPGRRRAWVGGGCTLGEVDRETQVHGLATPLGAVSQTGVAGLTLGGGYGWLRSRFGLACDAVRTFEVVTADGRVVRASADQHPDLYWALRGGGGNFGVVTGFEFELYPVGPEVLLVGVAYPIERAREVVAAWRDFMLEAPPELVTNVLCWTLPDVESFPAEVRGKEVVLLGGGWTGSVEEGLEVVKPLRELGGSVLDLTSPVTWCDLQTAFDALFEAGERRNYWKSMHFDELDGDLLDYFAARALERPDPWVIVSAFALGGRVLDEPPGGTAFGNRSARWLVSIDAGWEDAAKDETCIAWTRATWDELARRPGAGGCYLNFGGLGEEGEALVRGAVGAERYERLRRVKAAWDPENLFRVNANVRPAAEA